MPLPLMLIMAAAPSPAAPALGWPVACAPGRDCYVQNYVDHDPGAAWKDYRCRSMTYGGHTGTDIRIPSLAAMHAGVTVKAALAGTVRNMRDGVVDKPYVTGTDMHHQSCGNAVILDHPGGWTTIYCHMRQGSVRVKTGQAVAAGQPLGLVGESGEAAFPHLHFEIRRAGRLVDPFAYGVDPAACSGGRMLWSPAAAAALAYRSPSVINTGFAGGPVTMDQVEEMAMAKPSADGPLVAYVRAIGLEAGDVQSLTVTGPAGQVARSEIAPLDRAKAQYLMFAGAKRPAAGWPKGVYRATYKVSRAGATVASQSWTFGM
jgi:hypothetical protein